MVEKDGIAMQQIYVNNKNQMLTKSNTTNQFNNDPI